jgi:hypothetical protein
VKKHYKLKDIAETLLYRFYVDYVEDVREAVPEEQLKVLFQFPVSDNLLKTASAHLHSANLLADVSRSLGRKIYRISTKGILHVEEQLKDKNSAISKFKLHGESALNVVGDPVPPSEEKVPKPDKWEPLPIERDSPKHKEAVAAIEKTIETVKADNGYAATYPEERNSILWTLGAGVNALREGLITRQQVDVLLLKPLKYLAKKFVDSILGESAKATLAKLIAWFGWGS